MRFSGQGDVGGGTLLHATRQTSTAMLEPVVGAEGIWDELEAANPRDLNKRVLELG